MTTIETTVVHYPVIMHIPGGTWMWVNDIVLPEMFTSAGKQNN